MCIKQGKVAADLLLVRYVQLKKVVIEKLGLVSPGDAQEQGTIYTNLNRFGEGRCRECGYG